MSSSYFRIGALLAMLAVALGAFGAHGLESRLTDHYMDVFRTGVQYHMFHAIALLITGLAAEKTKSPKLMNWAGRLFVLGIVLFSGSLYVLAVSEVKALGAITPLGGVCFLAGWICLAIAAGRRA